MITFDKRLVAASVAIAAAAAVLSSFATAGSQPTPNTIVAARYSSEFAPSGAPASRAVDFAALTRQAATALEELKKKQQVNGTNNGPFLNARSDCSQQTWPNISSHCLTTANGAPLRRPARYISTDRPNRATVAAL
jgi:hypothetical protein